MSDTFHLRGFGYWAWKPQVILQTFEQIQDGDVLIYADIGCHIHKENQHKIRQYAATLKADRGGGISMGDPLC